MDRGRGQDSAKKKEREVTREGGGRGKKKRDNDRSIERELDNLQNIRTVTCLQELKYSPSRKVNNAAPTYQTRKEYLSLIG